MSTTRIQAAGKAAATPIDGDQQDHASTETRISGPVQRIALLPGAVIELPFSGADLMARLGENGNLAIRSGNETIVLLGYAAAADQAAIVIRNREGEELDIADILAATDPALDIVTAAGPTAGDQAGIVDNNGALFTRFDPSTGIGGLTASGGLAATELSYGAPAALARNTTETPDEEIAGLALPGEEPQEPREPLPIDVPGHSDDRSGDPIVPLWDLFGIDLVIGTRFNDDMRGFGGNDQMWGRGGDDHMHGGDGKDSLHGGDGNDHIDGGAGKDSLHGDDGDDYLVGGAGADHFHGGSGDDVIADADMSDLIGGSIDGGSGNDTVIISGIAAFDGSQGHADNITNIEVLNMTGDANPAMPGDQGTLLTLDPDAVLDMTDANNALFVQGDAEDAVTLLGSWTKSADSFIGDDGQAYDLYVGQTSSGVTVTLYVDQDVTTQI